MIRYLETRSDYAQAADMVCACFGLPMSGWEERERQLSARTALGAFDGAELTSMLTIEDFYLNLWGQPFKTCGLGNVCTLPERRESGLATALLRRALADMRPRGCALSLLYPASFAFYRRLGWEYAFDISTYELEPDDLIPPGDYGGLRRALPEDAGLISALYADFSGRTNLTLVRPPEYWTRLTENAAAPGGSWVFVRRAGDGYVAFDPSGEENRLDFVASTEAAAYAMAAFLCRRRMNARLELPRDSLLRRALPDPRRIRVCETPGPMLRVIDPGALLTALAGDCRVRVSDGEIAENNAEFTVGAGGEPVEADVRELAVLFAGQKPSGLDELEKALPRRAAFANLRF